MVQYNAGLAEIMVFMNLLCGQQSEADKQTNRQTAVTFAEHVQNTLQISICGKGRQSNKS